MSPKRTLRVSVTTGVLIALLRSASFAQGGPCAADRQKFCKDVKGMPALMKCFDDHRASLSEDCQHHMQTAREQMQAKRRGASQFVQACGGDMQTLCKDVKPGGGRLLQCLESNRGKLSSPCEASLPTAADKE